ncbi:unnamed protein product [Rotaria sordida]|uniref:DDE-1 domain-containing protein n=1 Tax=Rotaria sordida TaxID=392033 RepID=A0A818UJ30_9BILA|nr:unnamed protein product [Rotaria sordida]CAF3731233.1 unnamed protein product [Rotaria sordida]
MKAIKNGISIRQTAKNFHVPYTILCTHTADHIIYERIGRPTKFTVVEESYPVQAVLALQKRGEPVSINEFLNLTTQYASALNKDNLFPSDMNSTPIKKSRAKVTAGQVNEWFNLLTKVVNGNDVANRPGQIFNGDETDFSDTSVSSKVLVHRSTFNTYKIEEGTGRKSFTSVLICVSATGHILAPFVVYGSKRLFQEWYMDGPLNTGFSNSDSGRMENKTFYEWFQEMFLEATKHLPRPVLLILGGYKSHFMVETLELAVKNEVSFAIDPAITSSISIESSNVETSRHPTSYSSLLLPLSFQNVTTSSLFSYSSSATQTAISSNLSSVIDYAQPYYNQVPVY